MDLFSPVRAFFRGVRGRASLRRISIALVLVATTAAWVTVAAADITPAAQKVLDRYLEATGGRAANDSVRSMHGIGKVEAFGFSGTIENWSSHPDLRALQMEIGPLKIRQGYDGTTAWRTDPGGKVIVLDGLDRDRAIASGWFEANRWLEPDQGGGKVGVVADEKGAAGYHVLEIFAPNGDSRRLWFNDQTGLLDRVVARSDQRTVTNVLSEYRTFGNVKIPVVSKTSIEGMPANDVTVTFEAIEVNPAVDAARFAPPRDDVEAIRYLGAAGEARLPFEYLNRHLWLKVSVNDQPPADFIFDTGASITVIDSAYAASIGLEAGGKLQGQGAGALGSASLGTARTLRVPGMAGDGVELVNQQVGVLSINPFLEPFFWRPCAGVLGFNFIHQFVVEIDYDTGVITLHDPGTFEYKGAGTPIPIHLAGTVPTIEMTVDGKYEGEFRVDVGSSATVDLHRPFVEKHGLAKGRRTVEITSGGFGGTFSSLVTRMDTLRIGPFAIKRPMVSLSKAETGALSSEDYAGNIGNRILDRFKCTFDYERRVLYLDPGQRYATPDVFTRAGVQLAKYGDRIEAAQVIAGSPCARAGLENGDQVVSINGQPPTSFGPEGLRRLFEDAKPGTKVVFEVERDGKTKKLKVKLKDFI